MTVVGGSNFKHLWTKVKCQSSVNSALLVGKPLPNAELYLILFASIQTQPNLLRDLKTAKFNLFLA